MVWTKQIVRTRNLLVLGTEAIDLSAIPLILYAEVNPRIKWKHILV